MSATKDELDSFHTDKAVQDTIVESWLCVDCGVNTNPDSPSGPEIRIAFALGAKGIPLRIDRRAELYHVRRSVWKQAGMKPWGGCLCIGCLEARIGRQLRPKDFSPTDPWKDMPSTERLLNRRGFATVTVRTPDGTTKEVICDLADAPLIGGVVIDDDIPEYLHRAPKAAAS